MVCFVSPYLFFSYILFDHLSNRPLYLQLAALYVALPIIIMQIFMGIKQANWRPLVVHCGLSLMYVLRVYVRAACLVLPLKANTHREDERAASLRVLFIV